MRKLLIYREQIPEKDNMHEFSIIIRSKDSEQKEIEFDLICVLYDAIERHPQFKDVLIKDMR